VTFTRRVVCEAGRPLSDVITHGEGSSHFNSGPGESGAMYGADPRTWDVRQILREHQAFTRASRNFCTWVSRGAYPSLDMMKPRALIGTPPWPFSSYW